jgi:hypothetical protein
VFTAAAVLLRLFIVNPLCCSVIGLTAVDAARKNKELNLN